MNKNEKKMRQGVHKFDPDIRKMWFKCDYLLQKTRRDIHQRLVRIKK